MTNTETAVPEIEPGDITTLIEAPPNAVLCVVDEGGELRLEIDATGFADHHTIFLTRESALDHLRPEDPHRLNADDIAYIRDDYVPALQQDLVKHIRDHFPDDHTDDTEEDDEDTVSIPLVSFSDEEIDEAIEEGARIVSSTPRGDQISGVLVGRDDLGAFVRIRTGSGDEIDVFKDRTFLPHS